MSRFIFPSFRVSSLLLSAVPAAFCSWTQTLSAGQDSTRPLRQVDAIAYVACAKCLLACLFYFIFCFNYVLIAYYLILSAVCMALLLYYVPVSAAFGLFLGSDTIESNPLDIVWSQTYNVFLNTVKLLLAVIFAFFLDSVRTCLVLVLILFFGATVLSATYNFRHKHSPCSSYTLWHTRTYVFATATLLTAVCLLYSATAKISPSFTVKSISEESFYRGEGSVSFNTFQVSYFSFSVLLGLAFVSSSDAPFSFRRFASYQLRSQLYCLPSLCGVSPGRL